ncbi:MAG: exodeoxyribonuclease V subunit alpha [Oligosphaeraceae bacterium]
MSNNECPHSPIVTETVAMLFRRSKLKPTDYPELFSLLLTLGDETLANSHVAHPLTKEEEALLEKLLEKGDENLQNLLYKESEESKEDGNAPRHPVLWNPQTHLLYFSRHRAEERRIENFVCDCRERNEVDGIAPPEDDKIRALAPKLMHEKAEDQVEGVKKCVGKRLAMLTGGPGTGKTTTLGAILAWEFTQTPGLKVALCAPTGKAANQMQTSLQEELRNGLAKDVPEVKEKLNALPASTTHKLLGVNQYRQSLPKYHQGNPLPYDLVVLDEGSMADLHLFARLTDALPEKGRLLLLGDKDQLESVETGVVFGDLAEILPDDCKKSLTYNFRSEAIPELVRFAALLSQGKVEEAKEMVGRSYEAFRCQTPESDAFQEEVEEWWRCRALETPQPESFGSEEAEAEAWLDFHGQFKILCALREGRTGVTGMNQIMEKILQCEKNKRGLPLLHTRNDSVLHLQNGDLGVLLGDQVYFRVSSPESNEPKVKGFSWSLLQDQCEPAYAMTIHKSQGSSYAHVLVVLPEQENPILTRNLLYTAITRARTTCTIWAKNKILKEAIQQESRRVSGLARAFKINNPEP